MKKNLRFISLILTLVMCATLCVPAFAVTPDMREDAVVVYSENQLRAEIERGAKEIIIPLHNNVEIRELPRTDYMFPDEARSSYDNTYEIEIIGTGTHTVTKDVTKYVQNTNYVSEATWPTIQYAKGQTTEIEGSFSVEAGLPANILNLVQLNVTASAGIAHSVTNEETIIYPVPYGYRACIYYASCFEYFQFKIYTRDFTGKLVNTSYGSCTGKPISTQSHYNVRLIKV